MKKLYIGLFGMLTCATMIYPDRAENWNSDREFIGSKDYPFPPGKDSSPPEEDPAKEQPKPEDSDQPTPPDQQDDEES